MYDFLKNKILKIDKFTNILYSSFMYYFFKIIYIENNLQYKLFNIVSIDN